MINSTKLENCSNIQLTLPPRRTSGRFGGEQLRMAKIRKKIANLWPDLSIYIAKIQYFLKTNIVKKKMSKNVDFGPAF